MIKLGNDEYEIEGYTKLKKTLLLLLLLFHCHCLAAHWDSFQESFVTILLHYCSLYDTPAEFRIQNPESRIQPDTTKPASQCGIFT